MVSKFAPEANKAYSIDKNTLFHILEGAGSIQVDFKNYYDWDDKIIFLEKGQYIKFLTDQFVVRKIEFDNSSLFEDKSVRVLFKHLVSLGYINYVDCADCQKYLSDTLFSSPTDIIDISLRQWFWQNPFNANAEEYHVIFDIKDIIDAQFKNNLSNVALAKLLDNDDHNAHALVKEKVGLTVKNLYGKKRLLESQKEIAFSEKTIQEIAYEFGYKDPAYFNRVFKNNTASTPQEFRKTFGYDIDHRFTQELFLLLREFHTSHRQVDFYAKKMQMSQKAFSKTVQQKLQTSIGQLIRIEIIKTAKQYLDQGQSVKETAYALGFEESNHFSSFFKHYTGSTPSSFIIK